MKEFILDDDMEKILNELVDFVNGDEEDKELFDHEYITEGKVIGMAIFRLHASLGVSEKK